MKNHTAYLSLKVTSNAEYWWFQIVLGIIAIGLGIWFIATPIEAYVSFAVLFSSAMLITGFFEIINSVNVKSESKRWIVYFCGGIIDIILAIILIKTEDLDLQVLPILLGIWFLVRSIMFLMLYYELKNEHKNKSLWMPIFAIATMIFSFAIFAYYALGESTIEYTVSLAFLFMGLFRLSLGENLYRSRKKQLKN